MGKNSKKGPKKLKVKKESLRKLVDSELAKAGGAWAKANSGNCSSLDNWKCGTVP